MNPTIRSDAATSMKIVGETIGRKRSADSLIKPYASSKRSN